MYVLMAGSGERVSSVCVGVYVDLRVGRPRWRDRVDVRPQAFRKLRRSDTRALPAPIVLFGRLHQCAPWLPS